MAQASAKSRRFDRLSSTIFVALLAHGVIILGVTFAPVPTSDPNALPSLNVTLLVDTADAEKPLDTDLLAANDHAGTSDGDEARPTRTLLAREPQNLDGDPLGADLADAEALPADAPADQLVSRGPSNRQIEAVPETTDKAAPVPMMAAALLQQTSPDALVTEIDDKNADTASDDADRPAPSARESALASYMVGWRQRVERVGTAHFPLDSVTGGTETHRPLVEVSIDARGALHDIVLRRSSGNQRLDQAALTILELAAPFEPLPETILAESDMLRFAYEWDFSVVPR